MDLKFAGMLYGMTGKIVVSFKILVCGLHRT